MPVESRALYDHTDFFLGQKRPKKTSQTIALRLTPYDLHFRYALLLTDDTMILFVFGVLTKGHNHLSFFLHDNFQDRDTFNMCLNRKGNLGKAVDDHADNRHHGRADFKPHRLVWHLPRSF